MIDPVLLKVFPTGLIEDHPAGALEVDFADPSFGGIVLTMGCLQVCQRANRFLQVGFYMNCACIVVMGSAFDLQLTIFAQEEIRFMMNPELIVGMLFLPSMADNEAIEIVGAERFSNYKGWVLMESDVDVYNRVYGIKIQRERMSQVGISNQRSDQHHTC